MARLCGHLHQTGLLHSWSAHPLMKVVADFEASLEEHPPIAPGTPDPVRHSAPFADPVARLAAAAKKPAPKSR